jgi:hypothetical protein
MTADELREEISIEMELLDNVVRELSSLRADAKTRDPSIREKTAAAAFMAQFYGGVENILKRISRYYAVPVPSGDTWHIDLFKRFCKPSQHPFPELFDTSLTASMAAYRKFRHVVYHAYGFQLDWYRMQEGLTNIEGVFNQFKASVQNYLKTLNR